MVRSIWNQRKKVKIVLELPSIARISVGGKQFNYLTLRERMLRIFIIVLVSSFNSFTYASSELEAIQGTWDCSPEADTQLKLKNVITFKIDDMTFVHEGVATFIQDDGVESSIRSLASGSFIYQSSLLSEEIKDIKIEILNDETGFLKGAKESLKQALLSDKKPLLTISIDNESWQQVNTETNERTTCRKIEMPALDF